MALIEYIINSDGEGKVTIVPTIKRLDPGDEIQFVTSTPDAAVQFTGESPFLHPHVEKVYTLPRADSARVSLKPSSAIDMSQPLAQCGVIKEGGVFVAWLKGGGIPDTGSTMEG